MSDQHNRSFYLYDEDGLPINTETAQTIASNTQNPVNYIDHTAHNNDQSQYIPHPQFVNQATGQVHRETAQTIASNTQNPVNYIDHTAHNNDQSQYIPHPQFVNQATGQVHGETAQTIASNTQNPVNYIDHTAHNNDQSQYIPHPQFVNQATGQVHGETAQTIASNTQNPVNYIDHTAHNNDQSQYIPHPQFVNQATGQVHGETAPIEDVSLQTRADHLIFSNNPVIQTRCVDTIRRLELKHEAFPSATSVIDCTEIYTIFVLLKSLDEGNSFISECARAAGVQKTSLKTRLTNSMYQLEEDFERNKTYDLETTFTRKPKP